MEQICYDLPYDFEAVCRYYASDPLFRVEKTAITLLLPSGGIGGLSYENKRLVLLAENLQCDGAALEHIFQLKDARGTLLQAYADSELHSLLTTFQDLPLLLEPSPENALYRAILHQQVSMSAAFTVTRRLIERFGPERQGYFAMPAAEKLAALSLDDLCALGMNGAKAGTLSRLSAAIASGELRLPSQISHEEEYLDLHQRLTAYKGIGPWSVQCVALFGYGYPHLVPVADLGLQEALKRWYNLEDRPDQKWMRSWAESHQQGGSYLTFYLWQWKRAKALSQAKLKK